MPQPCRLYTERPTELRAQNFEIHFTYLPEKLQTAIPDLVSALQGRKHVLVFDTDIGSAITSGIFDRDCQERSVPVMLKALVGMILKGPDVIEGSAEGSLQDQAILTISQLLIFNSKKTASTERL